jgi:gliding motility-associated-like protein
MVATSQNGCVDQFSQVLTVLPALSVDVSFDTIACNPLTINVENNTIGALYNFWDFGDGFFDNVAEPVHTYQNFTQGDSIYQLEYIARGYEGCADTLYQDMYVLQQPEAIFTATPSNQTYPDATVSIIDLSNSGNVTYTWTLGDGETSNNPNLTEYTYGTWGLYTITLNLDNGACSSSAEQIIQIAAPVPIADFIGSGEGCEPFVVNFTNLSSFADSYVWDFGDGGQSNLENPTYTYYNAGEYTVSLTAIGEGGQNTVQHIDSIIIHPQAFAYFTPSQTTVYIPNDPVTYFNLSQNATSYQWDFGDGLTSTQENPVHFYTEIGNFTVTLTAINEYNCPNTYIAENLVFATASGTIEFPNAFTPNPTGPNGGYYDPNDPSANMNDVFHPNFSGIEEYQLLIYNRWGELIFESLDILIGWDGYYKGKLSQQDVYVWKVNARTVQGTYINQVGDVTLIR